MKRTSLEPGLLQVFRIYAWLRLASLIFFPFIGRRAMAEYQIDLTVPLILTMCESIFLLGYLYWSWLQEKMGRFYIPIALIIAVTALILMQQFSFTLRLSAQFSPFLYILLILVAWQYKYREVVIFSIGTAVMEVFLYQLFAQPEISALPNLSPMLERAVTFGFVASRTISFLVLGYVVTRLVSAQRSQRLALAEANQKLVRNASALEQLTISRERLRLSRELHDTLAHTLSALAVQFDALTTIWDPTPDKAREMVEQMQGTTRVGLDETRRALSALRASPLEEMGLSLAVRTLAEDFAARCALSLELNLPDNLDDLEPEVEQCYYRVAQEAFENVAKHAEAEKLTVWLERDDRGLRLRISDDGRGFVPADASNERQLGLRGMRERAEMIGAQIRVESQLGQGTTVDLNLEQEP